MESSFPLADKHVLLCDDEGIIVLQLRKALRRLGMSVCETSNGEDALHLALAERPDIILMDWNMPGLDGLEAARRILAAYPVCLILMSGYSDNASHEEAHAAGIHGFVVKPLTSEDLPALLVSAYDLFCQMHPLSTGSSRSADTDIER